jgi:hypothetical protein
MQQVLFAAKPLFSQPFEKSRLAEGLPEDRLDRGLPE